MSFLGHRVTPREMSDDREARAAVFAGRDSEVHSGLRWLQAWD